MELAVIRLFLKASFGNDSIALIQWAHEAGLSGICVIYSNTGWAARWWLPRVDKGFKLCQQYGFDATEIKSEGFEALARRKKSFPMQGIQFCTEDLKIRPSQKFMDEVDPNREGLVLVGKRRAESTQRADTEEFVLDSPIDSGRLLWHPLFAHSDEDRNALVLRAGFEITPTRSKECFPCINSNREDLRELAKDEERVVELETLEEDMGFTSKGKPRTLFRPHRYKGATGIREIIRWAQSDRGKFSLDDGTGGGKDCNDGQCGV